MRENRLLRYAKLVNKRSWILYGGLFLWGIIGAFIFVLPFRFGPEGASYYISTTMINRLEERYQLVLQGKTFDFSMVAHTIGFPLYYPILMKVLNIPNGRDFFMFVQSISSMAAMTLFPLITYKISNSFIIAAISPLVVHFSFGDMLYIIKTAEFSSQMWVIVLGIPLIFIYVKSQSNKIKMCLFAGIAFICSLSNVPRAQTAFPVFICIIPVLIGEVIHNKKRLKFCAVELLILLLSYNLLSSTIPNMVAKQWGYPGTTAYNSSPWFAILAGMGYIENDYGLEFEDFTIRDYIAERYPGVEYLSDECFEYCKIEALKIIKEDPVFVVKGLFIKFVECVEIQLKYIRGDILDRTGVKGYYSYQWIMIGIMIEIIILGILRKIKDFVFKYWQLFLFLFIASISGLCTAVLSVPGPRYFWGSIGCTGMIIAFAFLLMGSEIIFSLKDRLLSRSIVH